MSDSHLADIVVRNAKIYTMEPSRPKASAAAIAGGKFIAVGNAAEISQFIGEATTIIDAKQRLILPSLIDGHAHAFEGARADLFEIGLSPAHNFEQILDTVSVAARQRKEGEWLKGAGWSTARLITELASETALARLDEVTKGHPTVLYDLSRHTAFANSAAIQAAGIDESTQIEGGTIVRHSDGRPVGLFLEAACALIEAASPAMPAEIRRRTSLHAAALFNRHGVTGFAHALTSEATMRGFQELDQANELNAWVAAYISMDSFLTPERDGIGQPAIERRAQYASRHLAVDFVKFFMDGVPAAKTAAFKKPYGGMSELVPSFIPVEELANLITPLDAEGIQVKIHAIGDQAICDTLDAIEIVRQRNGADGPQHSIAHLSYISRDDIPRLAQLNVLADICPPLWFPNATLTGNINLLGAERGGDAWPVRDILMSGADVTIGTDWPAIALSPNPWPGMSALITRQDPSGVFPGTFRPDQALTIEEVLPLYTINVAKSLGFGDRTGSIATGKSADFIMLDRNIFEIPAEQIKDVGVLATYFGGKLVHQA